MHLFFQYINMVHTHIFTTLRVQPYTGGTDRQTQHHPASHHPPPATERGSLATSTEAGPALPSRSLHPKSAAQGQGALTPITQAPTDTGRPGAPSALTRLGSARRRRDPFSTPTPPVPAAGASRPAFPQPPRAGGRTAPRARASDRTS